MDASVATAATPDDARVRDLYNALRTGDHGVGFESFVGAFYFAQHATFSVFDARDAFVSSSAASERFLSYRDFQYALVKTARAVAVADPNAANASDVELLSKLLDTLTQRSQESADDERRRMDSIRKQLAKPSVLGVLDQHMRQLVQSFQLYGTANDLAPSQRKAKLGAKHDTSQPMTLDGFVDFLNAYFEYEEYFSYQKIEQLGTRVVDAFSSEPLHDDAPTTPIMLHFPQFIELFCRVAARFHVKTLEREGAQLRKAVESCRLEFSVELLLEKMNIRILNDDHCTNKSAHPQSQNTNAKKQDSVRAVTEVVLPGYDVGAVAIEALTLEDSNGAESARTTAVPSTASLLQEIAALLDANNDGGAAVNAKLRDAGAINGAKQQRPRSMLFARLPPRKSPPVSGTSHYKPPLWLEHNQDDGLFGTTGTWDPPQVTLIHEVVTPPQLPSNILKRLEYAITYQNTGQFHMALGALHKCRALFQEWRGNDVHDDTDVRVFFSLMDASVYDSARKDQRALAMYVDALRTAGRLPLHHQARGLVKSCLGCMLFYFNELSLAKRCHEQVLEFRRNSAGVGDEHVDTATAMNNLACCLSQDPQGTAIEEAYLYLKNAKRIYSERFGPVHPRVETVGRNFERVLASQRMVVVDPVAAVARGEYTHVIPGSRFQIKALVPVKKDKAGGAGGGKKKKKKGGKGGGKSGKKKK